MRKKTFVRNVAVLASGTISAQAITFAFMPVITRLFEAEAIGALGVFLSLTSITVQIVAFSYPIAIVLPKSDADALGIARLSLLLAIATSLLTFAVLTLFRKNIVSLVNIETISPYLFLIPVAMFAGGLLAIMNQWAIRKQLFKAKSATLAAHSFLLNGSKIVLGLFSPSVAGLIVLTTMGYFVQTAMLLFASKRTLVEVKEKRGSSSRIKLLAIRHMDFPLYRAPEQLLNAISQGMPILILATLFGPAPAGYIALAISALRAPSLVIGKSFSDVLYPRLSQASYDKEPLAPMIAKSTVLLAMISAPLLFIVAIWGPQLFAFIFGANWSPSGEYARWITLWVFIELINKPSITSLPVVSAQGLFLAYTVISIIVQISAMLIGYYLFNDAIISVAFFSIVTLLLNLCLILMTLRRCIKHDQQR